MASVRLAVIGAGSAQFSLGVVRDLAAIPTLWGSHVRFMDIDQHRLDVTHAVAGRYALVGYLVTGWGDAVGEPVGRGLGRHRYRVPTLLGVACTRTLEGSAAVGLAAFLAAAIALVAAFGLPLSAALTRAAAIGLATVAVEAFSPHGLDNFTTMVAAAALARWLA
jgi:dolichol kinase